MSATTADHPIKRARLSVGTTYTRPVEAIIADLECVGTSLEDWATETDTHRVIAEYADEATADEMAAARAHLDAVHRLVDGLVWAIADHAPGFNSDDVAERVRSAFNTFLGVDMLARCLASASSTREVTS